VAASVEGSVDLNPAELVARTGMQVKGEYQCAGCGYGVTIYRMLPRCPMCSGEEWESAPWSPFGRPGPSGAYVAVPSAGGE
jgi:hypothetical protein